MNKRFILNFFGHMKILYILIARSYLYTYIYLFMFSAFTWTAGKLTFLYSTHYKFLELFDILIYTYILDV